MSDNKNKSLNEMYSKDIGNILGIAILFPILNRSIQGFFDLIGLPFNGGIILYSIIIISILIVLIKYYNLITKRFIIVYLLTLFIMYLNYIIFEDTRIYYLEYEGYIRRMLVIFIPIAIIVTKITNFKYFVSIMRPLSYLGIIIGILGVTLGFLPYWDRLTYSIYLLPFTLFLYYHLRTNYRGLDVLFLLLGILLILIYGGRMSFFTIFIYMFFFELLNNYFKDKRLFIVYTTGIFSVAIIIFLFWDFITITLFNVASILNIESRTLEKMIFDEAFSFDTRKPIYSYIESELSELGFGMYGIFGDRVVLRQYGSWIAYSHNLIYEMLLSFGFVLGTLILLIILYKTLKGLFRGDILRRNIVLIFASLVFLRLFVSGSFVIEDNFYLMLGVLWSYMKIPMNSYISSGK